VECGLGTADPSGLASFVAVDDLVDTFILPRGLGRHDFADEIYRQGFAVVELSITDTIFTISVHNRIARSWDRLIAVRVDAYCERNIAAAVYVDFGFHDRQRTTERTVFIQAVTVTFRSYDNAAVGHQLLNKVQIRTPFGVCSEVLGQASMHRDQAIICQYPHFLLPIAKLWKRPLAVING
jgi:hypothetical protein